MASSILGFVWVFTLGVLGVTLKVLHGISLPSTVATVGSGVAVNNLLLGKRHKFSSGNLVVSLNGGGSRESSA